MHRLAFILLAAFTTMVSAEESLFDGKTLEGWDYDPAVWRVEDGMITGGSRTEKIKTNYFISTKQRYQNFELKMTIKCSGDPKTGLINSGIQIRSERVGGGTHMSGYQIDCGDGWFGKIYDEFRRNKVIAEPVDAEALKKVVDVQGWNRYRIRAEGPRIQVWINDVLAIDYTETDPKIAMNGQIAPQVHSGGIALVQVKDVTVEELPATPGVPTWDSLGGVEAAIKSVWPAPKAKAKGKAKAQGQAAAKIPAPAKGPDRVNFDFESGDLQGWFVTEGSFGHLVADNEEVRASGLPSNKEGKYFLSTLEGAPGGVVADEQTGILESPVFELTGPKIDLAVSGGKHDTTYVALCTLDGKEVRRASGAHSEVFQPVTWDAAEFVGKPVFVRLVDQHTKGWAHVTLDAFSAQGKMLPEETKKRQAAAKPTKPAANARPPLRGSFSTRNEALSPAEQLAGFTVPPGFVIELVASEEHGVINPIDISFDDAGRLWTQTAQMYPLDPAPEVGFGKAFQMMKDHSIVEKDPRFSKIHRLYTLKDRGEDKILVIDKPTETAQGPLRVWADGLTIPQSIMPYKDGCYVAHGSEMLFLDDTDKDGKQDAVTPILSGFGFIDTHTMAHSIVRGPGEWMHFSHGAVNSGNVKVIKSGKELHITYSKNARFSIDGERLEILNCHRDNNWGYQVQASGQWYATSANDNGYSVLPSEPMSSTPGNGYDSIRPYAPFFPAIHQFRVGGTGISGLAFSEDGDHGFPAKQWKDVAILANPITGALNCVRISRKPDGSVEASLLADLLKCRDKMFRPVNIEFGPDGCLYIADWYNKIISHNEVDRMHPDRDKEHGRIWRVRHASQKPFTIPNVAAAADSGLILHLTKGRTLWEKRAAWHQIVDRKAFELAPELKRLIVDPSLAKDSRILALWSLEGLMVYDKQLLKGAIADADADIRREAIRSLASFKATASDVAELVGPYIEDANCMVRSQVLRTLDEIQTANTETIELLVQAAKPAAINNQLGGNYERNFERFLVRKALESYNDELVAFLGTEAAKKCPAQNILWAIQALPEQQRVTLFAKSIKEASPDGIDGNTLVAISKMLAYSEIKEVVAPAFEQRGDVLLQLALENQQKAEVSKIAAFYVDRIDALLSSLDPKQVSEGIQLVHQLRSPFHTQKITQLLQQNPTGSDARRLFAALVHDKEITVDAYLTIFRNTAFDVDLRVSALAACTVKDEKRALAEAVEFVPQLGEDRKRQLVTLFSHTLEGNSIIKTLWERKILSTELWDYDSAYRTKDGNMSNWSATEITNDPWDKNQPRQAKLAAEKDPRGAEIFSVVHKGEQESKAALKGKVQAFVAAVRDLKGDPAVGQAIFQSCLTCHKVAGVGQEFAPPLDGGKQRVTEHLITAIVDPDAAVEGVYGLYSVVRRDGSFVEGYLIKTDKDGTLIGQQGGARVFTAGDAILYQGSVNSRSFMQKGFAGFSEQTMSDLVAYIQTIP